MKYDWIYFYWILVLELIFCPFLYLIEALSKHICFKKSPFKLRETANSNKIIIGIHDWANYDLVRTKEVNSISFKCGLSSQLERFKDYKGKKQLLINITISDFNSANIHKYNNLNITPTHNVGMDFRGYATTIKSYSESDNPYILLLNSSVASDQVDFIDDYIDFLEQHPEVGLVGISYSTKMYQTLIRNNFTPHIQSFFLLSTMNIMKEAMTNNTFPGEAISHKRLLIRKGEIELSRRIQNMGYRLAIITEEGKPFIFPKSDPFFNTAYKQWKMPFGEYRFHTAFPNKINSIKKQYLV